MKSLVVYALKARYDVEAYDTSGRLDAKRLSREAALGGADLVVSFGGDGTANEIVNGLVGHDVPVTFLPGGSTNVVCRTLGIPNDIVDATEHLLSIRDDLRPVWIDLGRAADRYFMFACGMGLDASAFKKVDEHPKHKARFGEYFFAASVLRAYIAEYLRRPFKLDIDAGDIGHLFGYTAMVQNSDPLTYFGRRPLRLCDDVDLRSGAFSIAMLDRITQRDVPMLAYRALSGGTLASHKHIEHLSNVKSAVVRSVCDDPDQEPTPFPVQMDGDFVGTFTRLDFEIHPAILPVVY